MNFASRAGSVSSFGIEWAAWVKYNTHKELQKLKQTEKINEIDLYC